MPSRTRLPHLFLLCLWGSLLPAEGIDALFERAVYDANAVVPLVESVSAELSRVSPARAVALVDRLAPYTDQLFFGPELVPAMERLRLTHYQVRAGDTPQKIAQEHGIGLGLLEMLNPYLEPARLQIGQSLKVLDLSAQPLRIYVWRSRFRCFLLYPGPNDHQIVMAGLKVGVGQPGRETPLGVSHIDLKQRDPQWTDPDTGEVFAPDDPGNVLGGYWISIANGPENRFKGIGFHGYTGAPSEQWLEKSGSRGCLRMLQDDIRKLAAASIIGTPVAILE